MALRIGGVRGQRGQGQPTANEELVEEMRRMRAQLEAVETGRQRDPEVGNVSEPEEEGQAEAEVPVQETAELRFLRSILGTSSRPRPELPVYDGSLIAEHLIDWISDLDKYFEYDEVEENKRVRFAVTRLKGHASLWWDSVQAERRKENKPLINSWDRMVAKMSVCGGTVFRLKGGKRTSL